jgi:hypothetical protein
MTVFRDLSQHILDIAENGIKAGATLLHIDIQEDFTQDTLTLAVEDNGCGMDAATLACVADPWVTSRTDRKVGLGIPFLKQTAEMCDGAFEIHSALGQGTTTRATFRHSHIDRPPLGDLIGTLRCIIVGNPAVDLVYHHQVDGRTFTLDTREIREVLGEEVPLSDPEVLAFLRTTLEEGVRALGGEPVLGVGG